MKYSHLLPLVCAAGIGLVTEVAQAADEDALMTRILPSAELNMGYGRSALWTLPVVATQYPPAQPTPGMQAALKAQDEGRFLDALILLDEDARRIPPGAEAGDELTLLRASFLLQGRQFRQALDALKPLLAQPRHAANAYALSAMAYLEQGQTQDGLDAAQRAHGMKDGMLAHLALSYALQAVGRLAEARKEMQDFNAAHPGSAIGLAREAELALTVDQIGAARTLVARAESVDRTHPYVIAVCGLVALIDGDAAEAKKAFTAALRRDPKDAKALFGLGLAEARLGNFEAAQDNLKAANDADPGNALILTYLCRSQQNLGQPEAARASWRRAQQLDPKDPVPWLYQAQAELQGSRPQDARASLREADARRANRSVYRGESLLREDEELLLANLAEAQRQLGMETLAFQTLASGLDVHSSTSLRNQADLLQGQRFGESARRSLNLQSMFNERPGTLPAALDLYGDGAGMTGAGAPVHGFVSELGAQQTSYNNYDELFSRRTRIEAEATGAGKNSMGAQVRAGIGSETLGIGLAHMQFTTDGFGPTEALDNRAFRAVLQWQPEKATQLFLSRQNFDSDWNGVFYPAQPWAMSARLADTSQVTRLGLRHSLGEDGSREIRALLSRQETDQGVATAAAYKGTSSAHSTELQYRQSGAGYATQWGMQHYRGDMNFDFAYGGSQGNTISSQHVYAAWQQALSTAWQIEGGLGWRKLENVFVPMSYYATYLKSWLPRLGAVYTPDAATHVRLAAWKDMGLPAVGDATLAPATLAGLVLTRPADMTNPGGQLVRAVALAADRQLDAQWLLAGEVRQRRLDAPGVGTDFATGQHYQYFTYGRNDESRLALHWQPQAQPWAVSLAYDYERIHNDPGAAGLDSVNEQTLRASQLDIRWFASAQWTANLALSHNRVSGSLNATDTTTWMTVFPEYRSSFNQADASLSWKFGGPLGGLLVAGVRNAGDTHFTYADVDKLNPRFSTGRLMYARIRLAW